MKQDVATKWSEALKSGKYAQGKGRLRDVGSAFCCLGVLCDIYMKDTQGAGGWDIMSGSFKVGNEYESGILPGPVREWAGMKTHCGNFKEGPATPTLSLAVLNDDGASFASIAEVIDKNWERL